MVSLQCGMRQTTNNNNCARPGQVAFDERSYKLATLAVESFGRLGKEGSDLIDQVAASVYCRKDGRIVPDTDIRRLQRMPLPDHLGDYIPRSRFCDESSVSASSERPPGRSGEGEEEAGGTYAADDLGMER